MALSSDKIEKLGDDLAKDLKRTMQDHYNRARKHEVTKQDAESIIFNGWGKAGDFRYRDADAAAPEKPRE